MTEKQQIRKYLSYYFQRKITGIVGRSDSSIQRCLERHCMTRNVKCLKMWTLINSGGSKYIFALLDTKDDPTVVTIGYYYSPVNKWVSAK